MVGLMTRYHLIIVFKSFDKPLHLYYKVLSSHDQMKKVFGDDIIRAELVTSHYRDHRDDITLIRQEREILK